jgi:hypothetical protein
MWFDTISDGLRPSRGNRGQPLKKKPPPVKFTPSSLKLHEPLESGFIGSTVEAANRSAKLPEHGSAGLISPVGCQSVLEPAKNVLDREPSRSPNPRSEDREE